MMASTLHPTSSRSFTPLSTITINTPHVLHRASCNPAMDLVVLLAPAQPVASAPGDIKGKGKAVAPDMSSWRGTKLVLWRMLGSQVWEMEARGWIAGLAWSIDGLFLSVMLIMNSTRKAVVEHRSVHTGEIVKIVPLDLPTSIWDNDSWDVQMEWRENSLDWEAPKNGSAQGIIASLPAVTPVEPPKPAVLNPFAKVAAASTSKLPHSKLATFPSLLASSPAQPPHILQINLAGRRIRLLTGSFPCPRTISAPYLRLSQSSNMLEGFLNTVLRGLEAMESAWRDPYKQTMIWREELEECGKLQGVTVEDVHADLFRLLMTGRSREAVSEWLGNKLTGRMLAKWEQSLQSSFQTIQKVISESVSPALEKVMILLHELRSWQRQSTLPLSLDKIEQSIDLVGGMIKLIERMRLDAVHELSAAAAWITWLKFEAAQAGSGGGDEPHSATHDLKLTWSFLVNGFVRSIFSTYFPDNTPMRPPTDCISEIFVKSLRPAPAQTNLDEVISETISKLTGRSTLAFKSPVVDQEEAMSMDQSSMQLSISGTQEDESRDLGINSDEAVVSDDEILPSDDEDMGSSHKEEVEVKREMEMEPWVWANSLILAVETLVKAAVGDEGSDEDEHLLKGLIDTRRTNSEVWSATIGNDGSHLILLQSSPSQSSITLSISDGSILNLQFFDDLELAILVETFNGRYLATVDYKSYLDQMIPIPTGSSDLMNLSRSHTAIPLLYHRSRYLAPSSENSRSLPTLSLNGRKGRRVGCVMGMKDDAEVEVWDMEGDEEDEDEEGEGEEEEGQEDESM